MDKRDIRPGGFWAVGVFVAGVVGACVFVAGVAGACVFVAGVAGACVFVAGVAGVCVFVAGVAGACVFVAGVTGACVFGGDVAGDFVAALMSKINSSHTSVDSGLALEISIVSYQDKILMLFSLIPRLSSLSMHGEAGMWPTANIAHIP